MLERPFNCRNTVSNRYDQTTHLIQRISLLDGWYLQPESSVRSKFWRLDRILLVGPTHLHILADQGFRWP